MKMKNKKKYLVWTALIALSVILLFSSGILTAQESSWLDGWDLRKEITITEISGNALTDYQVKIEVGYEPQMKSDFSDLRFTDSDGITLLNYWVEEYTEESSATVWVKVPEIPASGVKKIYMYYGNSGAASLSDGDAVFEFFDDFEDDSIDSKWSFQGLSSYEESGGSLNLEANTNTWGNLDTGAHATISSPLSSYHAWVDAEWVARSSDLAQIYLNLKSSTSRIARCGMRDPWAGNSGYREAWAEGGESYGSGPGTEPASGRKVFAVGTTTVRALESWARGEEQREGWTSLFIYPPFSFQVVDGLMRLAVLRISSVR